MKIPSEMLLEGRRCIDEFSQVELITDLAWDVDDSVWYFSINVHHNFAGRNIPKETVWYITVQDIFPYGKVKIFPSVIGGISDTFYHQSNNGLISENGLWREGDVCLKDPLESVADINIEPLEATGRIKWNIIRLLEWIDKAENDNLVSEQDNFELPDVNELKKTQIIFDEDCVSFMQWEDAGTKSGIFKMYYQGNSQYFVDSFWDEKGNLCVQNVWGGYVDKSDKNFYKGIWLIVDHVPVVNRWQAPNTIGELKEAFELNNLLWDTDVVRLLDKMRDGKRHLFLIGFPIPRRFGGEYENYHWWAWMLPVLSHHNKTQKGFRANKAGWRYRDSSNVLKDNQQIEWCFSENWNQKQILNRGMFDRKITSKKFAIIGVGSMGSIIAELLVRSGVWKILLVDGDSLAVGNLARHTLSIKSLHQNKAAELQKRLEEISSHVQAEALTEYLSPDNLSYLNSYDVVIDCTAKDAIINLLSQISERKTFVSVSVGYKAERLYFIYYKGKGFNSSMFDSRMERITQQDKEQMLADGLPWEGIGCWHPVFPALGCDMYLAATSAVEMLIQLIAREEEGSHNYILQKNMEWMVYSLVMKEYENIELKSKIFIEDAAYHKLLSIVADNKNKLETGGIIIGYYDEMCQNAVITEFTKPPEDSKAARFRFYRGIKGLKSLLQQCWKEQNEYYLGEWHLHPKSNPTPSATDIAQMKKIAQDKNFNCKEPILMILGEVAKVKVISLSICKNDQILYYDERAEIYEDT